MLSGLLCEGKKGPEQVSGVPQGNGDGWMKPWAEMTAGARFGVLGAVAAVVAALLWGAWSVRGVPPSGPTATGAAPEGEAAPATEPVAEAATPTEEAGEAAAEPADDVTSGETAATETAEPAPATADAPADPAAEADADADADASAAEPAAAEETQAAAATGQDGAAEATGTGAESATDAVAEQAPAEAAPVADLPAPPVFDLVRVERDGAALVAGKAAPSAMLSLRVTGSEIASVPADGQGNFVAMFNLAPSNAPRVLSLVMQLADGTEIASEGSVVIAPTVAPAVMASAPADAAGTDAAGDTSAASEAVPAAPQEAPAALLVTDEGAKVLQSADDLPAELVANVTIDTITYTPEGAVQLAGRGTADRAVRIYLDNARIADATVSAGGDWAVTLPDVAPGIYTLRADQIDASGKVTSRFETPFKRETVEALAAATDAASGTTATATEGGAQSDAAAPASEETVAAADPASADAAAAGPLTVTVQPGFTLWRIATENLGEGIRYVQVFEANKDQIRDPDLIYPGQVFTIPKAD